MCTTRPIQKREASAAESFGAHRAELVLLNLDGGSSLFEARHTSTRNQLQLTLIIQLRGPTYRKFEPFAGNENLIGRKQYTVAADVNGFSTTFLATVFLIENFKADFPLNWKSICRATFYSAFLKRR